MDSSMQTKLGSEVCCFHIIPPQTRPKQNESSSGVLDFEMLLGGRCTVCCLHLNLTIMKTECGCKHLYCSLVYRLFNLYI